MPMLIINTCSKTTNYDALEAIKKFMKHNYKSGRYQRIKDISVKSGRLLKVREISIHNDNSPCTSMFKITNEEEL